MTTTLETDLYGTVCRTTLPAPIWEGRTIDSNQVATGVYRTGLYVQPRAGGGRVVEQTYSCWDDGHGYCRGDRYRVLNEQEVTRLLGEGWPEEVAGRLERYATQDR